MAILPMACHKITDVAGLARRYSIGERPSAQVNMNSARNAQCRRRGSACAGNVNNGTMNW